MSSLTLGLILAIVFFFMLVSQIFGLQKELRKLKSITTKLVKDLKDIKDKNGE